MKNIFFKYKYFLFVCVFLSWIIFSLSAIADINTRQKLSAKANSDTIPEKKIVSKQDSDKAKELFVEGKIFELQGKNSEALQSYRAALKYEKSAGIYYAIANLFYNQGRFKDAMMEINNALQLEPESVKYNEIKANIYYQQSNFQKAAEIYEDILKKDRENVSYMYILARIYQELNMPANSVELYEKITDLAGYDFEVLKRMFDIYYNYKNYDKCIEVLKAALQLDPYDISFLQQLAALYARLERYQEAKEIYEDLFRLNPRDKDIQTELIKLYFRLDEYGKGFENFAILLQKDTLTYEEKMQIGEIYYKMISQDSSVMDIARNIFTSIKADYPEEWGPYFYLGLIGVINKDSADYDKNFETVLKLVPESAGKEIYMQIGYTYFDILRNEKAGNVVSKAINIYGGDFRSYFLYGLILQRKNEESQAIEYFEKALELNPEDLSVLSTLALAYNTAKRYSESEAVYERALMISPENPLILNNYAYNLSQRGVKLDKALVMSKRAVEIEPNSASYLDTIGWVYYMMGEYEQARYYIERSVTINPDSWVVLDHLGDVYDKLNDKVNAIKYWGKALELNPNASEVKEKLNR